MKKTILILLLSVVFGQIDQSVALEKVNDYKNYTSAFLNFKSISDPAIQSCIDVINKQDEEIKLKDEIISSQNKTINELKEGK